MIALLCGKFSCTLQKPLNLQLPGATGKGRDVLQTAERSGWRESFVNLAGCVTLTVPKWNTACLLGEV